MTRREMRMKKKRSHAQTSAILLAQQNQKEDLVINLGQVRDAPPVLSIGDLIVSTIEEATNRSKRQRFQFSTRGNRSTLEPEQMEPVLERKNNIITILL